MYAADGNQVTTAKKTTLKFPLKKDQILINFTLFVTSFLPKQKQTNPQTMQAKLPKDTALTQYRLRQHDHNQTFKESQVVIWSKREK